MPHRMGLGHAVQQQQRRSGPTTSTVDLTPRHGDVERVETVEHVIISMDQPIGHARTADGPLERTAVGDQDRAGSRLARAPRCRSDRIRREDRVGRERLGTRNPAMRQEVQLARIVQTLTTRRRPRLRGVDEPVLGSRLPPYQQVGVETGNV